jgi:hypothetical protein
VDRVSGFPLSHENPKDPIWSDRCSVRWVSVSVFSGSARPNENLTMRTTKTRIGMRYSLDFRTSVGYGKPNAAGGV